MVARMHLLLKADGNQSSYRWHQPRGLGVVRRVTRSSGSVPSLQDELQTVLKNLDTGRPKGAAMAFMSTRPSLPDPVFANY
jgi:hypothetical protein